MVLQKSKIHVMPNVGLWPGLVIDLDQGRKWQSKVTGKKKGGIQPPFY